MKYLLMFALLTSCGYDESLDNKRKSFPNIHPDLVNIWNKTSDFFKENGVCCGPRGFLKTEVDRVDAFERDIVGKCISWSDRNVILIRKPEQLHSMTLETVILHERLHCEWSLGHVNDVYDIMNPQIQSVKFLENNLEEMKRRMIQQIKK